MIEALLFCWIVVIVVVDDKSMKRANDVVKHQSSRGFFSGHASSFHGFLVPFLSFLSFFLLIWKEDFFLFFCFTLIYFISSFPPCYSREKSLKRRGMDSTRKWHLIVVIKNFWEWVKRTH